MIKILIVSFLVSSAFGSSKLLNMSEKEHFQSLTCKQEVSDLLVQWESVSNWSKHFVDKDTLKFLSPTRNFSKWVEVYFGKKNNTMKLLTPSDVLSVSFNKKCEKNVSLEKVIKKTEENAMDDKKLLELLQKNKNGVIYSYGPQMPLSVDGIKQIREAIKNKNLKLTLVLPSLMSLKELKKQLLKKKIIVDEFIVSSSIELALRGTFLHLPSIITYNNSKLDRRARPGHEISHLYSKYINRKMENK